MELLTQRDPRHHCDCGAGGWCCARHWSTLLGLPEPKEGWDGLTAVRTECTLCMGEQVRGKL